MMVVVTLLIINVDILQIFYDKVHPLQKTRLNYFAKDVTEQLVDESTKGAFSKQETCRIEMSQL